MGGMRRIKLDKSNGGRTHNWGHNNIAESDDSLVTSVR